MPDRLRFLRKKPQIGLGKARLAKRGCNINSRPSKAQITPRTGWKTAFRQAAFLFPLQADNTMRLALYEPDIPQNAGTMLRLAACLGVAADVIEPCGFILSDSRLKRAGMDYLLQAEIQRHSSWTAFQAWRAEMARTEAARGGPQGHRLLLLTTKGDIPYPDFAFRPDDILMVGRESAGVPPEVAEAADARLVIPLRPGLRSLNVATAAAMVLGEALRQTAGFPAAEASSLPSS